MLPNRWYYNNFLIASEAGLFGNTLTGQYELLNSGKQYFEEYIDDAERNALRQYVAMLLSNMVEYEDGVSVASFSDMAECNIGADSATAKAINKLMKRGIIQGYPDNGFRPNGEVTRAELVAMFTRIFDLYNWDKLSLHDNLYANFYLYFWQQEQEIIELVNAERTEAGSHTLKFDVNLQALARIKSIDFMVNDYFAHESPIYGRPAEMSKQFGYISTVGENIATICNSASSVHKIWRNSPGHHDNYMNSSYTVMACGMTIWKNCLPSTIFASTVKMSKPFSHI